MSTYCHIALTILTPEATILEKNVSKVSLPGTKGRFMILKDHAPIISSLDEGYIVIESEDGEEKIYVRSGFIEAANNKVMICAEV